MRLIITVVCVLMATAALAGDTHNTGGSSGLRPGDLDAIETEVDNVAAQAEGAQDDVDALRTDFDALPSRTVSSSPPVNGGANPCGPGDTWIMTHATPGSSKFFWCSDPTAEEWSGVTGAAP